MVRARKSNFWHLSLSRLRSRRDNDDQAAQSPSDEVHSIPPASPTSRIGINGDLKNGFYGYPHPVAFEEGIKSAPGSMVLRRSTPGHDDLGDDFSPPSSPHSRPYTVSSDEWVIVSSKSSPPESQVISMNDLSAVQMAIHLGNVLKIFTRIYAVAKMLYVIFLAYGLELDESNTRLFYWIDRAEAEIRTDSLATMIQNVENLFYTLYCTVEFELANIELCALFKMGSRPLTTQEQFYLPEPNHLYRLFLAFKDLLDSPLICEDSHSKPVQDIITQYQEDHVRGLIGKDAMKGFFKDDLLGYRRYALNIVSDRTSAYSMKWTALLSHFSRIPSEVLAVMSERYFTIIPKVSPEQDITAAELAFVNLKATNPTGWERDLILDHRMSTLATLEGKSIGEERRDDQRVRLLTTARNRKCICTSVCRCARECTYFVERCCPCAERQLRLMLARRRKGTGQYSFTVRTNNLARYCFEGLSSLRRDVSDEHFEDEMESIFEIFDLEIQKERAGVALNWI